MIRKSVIESEYPAGKPRPIERAPRDAPGPLSDGYFERKLDQVAIYQNVILRSRRLGVGFAHSRQNMRLDGGIDSTGCL